MRYIWLLYNIEKQKAKNTGQSLKAEESTENQEHLF